MNLRFDPESALHDGPERRMPAADADESALISLVGRCVEQLDEAHRHLLTLRIGLKLSYEQIAAELQTHADEARRRVYQARSSLHILLQDHCSEFETAPLSRPAAGWSRLTAPRSANRGALR